MIARTIYIPQSTYKSITKYPQREYTHTTQRHQTDFYGLAEDGGKHIAHTAAATTTKNERNENYY